MNIGILGGTFDPIHIGHLGISEAAKSYANLEKVLFIPAGNPRLKQGEPLASVEHRLEMVRLAVEGISDFEVCDIEIHRTGPTYSVDTLVELSANLKPTDNLFFILGVDVLGQLHHWKDPERVLALCQMLVLGRPSEHAFDLEECYKRVPKAKERIQLVSAPLIDVSATDIRRRVVAGASLKGLVPDVVAEYIRSQKLYQTIGKGRTTS
ncbi:MAG: nicotinate (nicotinamide) nucleotide adenylyltransferase [SAR202 cluster bacterium Ae2-Chloro-G2]|nr:MAG: nicotinate (nicotinamide) nucleotide adenylyltransferase [SAR202 cluster bacterium Ae2-Chloro-G2]|tara:strand:- start:660 stop:1286 length:627 start_codon:yes stop_codon:yes gene_type:complete